MDSSNGLSIKTTALFKMNDVLGFEGGVQADNVDRQMTGELYAGFGAMF